MKSLITIFLLFGIGLSIFTYFNSAEDRAEHLIFLGAPVAVEALLLLIFIISPPKTPYRKTIGITLIVWTIILLLILLAYAYLLGLARAFKN